MSHQSKIFTERKVDIPNRSGFDLSHENLLTMKVGTLTPVLCEEVIPNETFSLKQMSQIQLPPMATDFYGRVDMRFEAFFVPNRILWAGWKNFWTMPTENPFGGGNNQTYRPLTTPGVNVVYNPKNNKLGRGTLADYLGFKTDTSSYASGYTIPIPNILPFVAYHKIYDEWYRNSKIQRPAFMSPTTQAGNAEVANLPNSFTTQVTGTTFEDGVSLFDLRQRNWAKDYYTTSTLFPQGATNPSTVTFSIPGGTAVSQSSFTIPQLRSANVLQRWLERNNIAGERYADQIKAQYGVLPADAVVDRPIFLGSAKFGIYNKSVYQQSNDTGTTTNPFNSVGSKYATANGFGQDSLIDNFTATEHGYIIVLASIVPHAYYSTGTRRQMLHSKPGDFAMPLLQGVGDQKIYVSELMGGTNTVDTFGYTLENAEYKYHDDEVHGLLADGQSLSAFALQRSFDDENYPSLNSDFITIPTNYLDQVTAVAGDMSKYGAWADIYFDFKRVSPLSEYVIPTLGDLRDTHKETIPVGGRML